MRIRTLSALLLAVLLAITAGGSALGQAPVRVFVDGEQVQFDQPPIVIGSRVLVPLRGIFEKMGAFVEWNPGTRTVRAVRATTVVELQIGSPIARVNGSPITLDVPAQIVGGRTLVPLRFISESLGASVQYIADSRTVVISTTAAGPPPPPPPPPQPTGQTVKGVITAVTLAQTSQDVPTVTVESGNIAYRVRITVDTAITRVEVGTGAGGSVGVAALRPGDDAEVTLANNVATRIRATYLLTRGRIEAIARAGATLVLTDGRSIKWNPAVVVMRDGTKVGVDALQAGQTVEMRLNPTTREAWEITILSGTAQTTGEMNLSVAQPKPGATVGNPIRVAGQTVAGAEVEIVVTWFLGAQVGRKVVTAGSNGRFNTTVPVTVIVPNSPYLITVTARHPQQGQRSVQFTVTVS